MLSITAKDLMTETAEDSPAKLALYVIIYKVHADNFIATSIITMTASNMPA